MNDEQLVEYINEANVNFINSRFRDSANTFGQIAKACRRADFVEDTIYFSYRSIIAHERDENEKAIQNIMSDLGIYLLKQSAKLSGKLISKTEDLAERLSIMRRTEKILAHLLMEEEREPVLQSIIMICEQLMEEQSAESVLQYIDIIREYSNDKKYLRRSVEIYENIADSYVCHKYPDDRKKNDEEEYSFKNHYYTKALKIATFNQFEDLIVKLKEKIR